MKLINRLFEPDGKVVPLFEVDGSFLLQLGLGSHPLLRFYGHGSDLLIAIWLDEVLLLTLGKLQGEVVGKSGEAEEILSELQQDLLILFSRCLSPALPFQAY